MPTEFSDALLNELQTRIHYTFRDPGLLRTAMTHSSAKELEGDCNERMEFFGDAVVGLTVSEHLYERFPDNPEGTLSMMKSVLVSAKTLSEAADELKLEQFVVVGKGLARRKALPRSILCNVFEALVAAMYLDGGGDRAREMVLFFMRSKVDEIVRDEHEKNYKSLLQDHAQKVHSMVPNYRVVSETGPDHKKLFEVMVQVGRETFGPGHGASKKEAEQEVARAALEKLGLIESQNP